MYAVIITIIITIIIIISSSSSSSITIIIISSSSSSSILARANRPHTSIHQFTKCLGLGSGVPVIDLIIL